MSTVYAPTSTVLTWLLEQNRFDDALLMLEVGAADPSVNDQEAFEIACQKGDLKFVSYCLDKKLVDPAFQNFHCLAHAISSRSTELVSYLLAKVPTGFESAIQSGLSHSCINQPLDMLRVLAKDPRSNPAQVINSGFFRLTDEQREILMSYE